MIFPSDYPSEHTNQPKAIKKILAEWGIIHPGLCEKCKKCKLELESCCLKHILKIQSDFLAQKSLMQEVIEAAGHMCIFLPKFHCEPNFIKYYWSAVKKYLWEHCDFTFSTIWKWKHQLYQWMDAYRSGLGTTDAQKQVQKFTLTRYKSHRHILELVARAMDQ